MNDNEKKPAKLTFEQIIKRTIISFVICGLLSLIYLGSVYGFAWTLENVSNSIFVVNLPIFLIAVIIQTGATRLTLGVSFSTRMLFTYRKMKDEYDNFGVYYNEKAPGHVKNVIYIIIATSVWILTAFIISYIYLLQTPNM